MKICLVNPALVLPKRLGKPFHVFLPLGLAYIAAVLEREHEVVVLDAIAEGWEHPQEAGDKYIFGLHGEDIRERISDICADVVGISMLFSFNADSALSVASIVKKLNRKTLVILGGAGCSVQSERYLSRADVDFVVIGEGERTVVELIGKIEEDLFGQLKEIKGIGYKQQGKLIVTEPRPLIEDLDSIPFPAWHLFKMSEYAAAAREARGSRHSYSYSDRWASMITSRGCPFNCNFCSIKLTMGRKFRSRSPGNIISEIEQLVNVFGIKHINFEDDNFTFDKDRVRTVCRQIVEKKCGITWSCPNGIRADIIDEDLVEQMKHSGCKRVFVAPESGVQHVVDDIIGKHIDLKRVEEAVKLFKKHGITVDGSFVIGSIGETKKDIWKTIRYALKLKKLGMSKAGIHIATPFYGTKLYDQAVEKQYMNKQMESDEFFSNNPVIETPEWSRSDLRRLQIIANWMINYSLVEKVVSVLRKIYGLFRSVIPKRALSYISRASN